METQSAAEAIGAALEHDTEVDLHHGRIRLEDSLGKYLLEGEVESISQKRRAAQIAGQIVGVEKVEDRLSVRPGQEREDGAIADSLRVAFLSEPVFYEFAIAIGEREQGELLRRPGDPKGYLDLRVDSGVVSMMGEAWSLSHKRLASLLAWWTPGVRRVENRLVVHPDEKDNDGEINDAVIMALEKDPLIHATQIKPSTREGTVLLEGLVATTQERQMAEYDVWYLDSGISGVLNRIEVQSRTEAGRSPA